jgi:hypothetical protein
MKQFKAYTKNGIVNFSRNGGIRFIPVFTINDGVAVRKVKNKHFYGQHHSFFLNDCVLGEIEKNADTIKLMSDKWEYTAKVDDWKSKGITIDSEMFGKQIGLPTKEMIKQSRE